MTPSELKHQYETSIGGHFFERKTMEFFGDTMRNYNVRDAGGCWELYRRKPVKHGLKNSAYFDKDSFKQRFDKDNFKQRFDKEG